MANLPINNDDVTIFSTDSSVDSWSPEAPTRPVTTEVNVSPAAAPRREFPYTPDYAFPFLEAAAAAQAGASFASETPQSATAPAGENTLNSATEAVPSHGEGAQPAQASPFHHEQQQGIPAHEQYSPFSHAGQEAHFSHEQYSPFSHAGQEAHFSHEQAPSFQAGQEQHSPFSHAGQEQAPSFQAGQEQHSPFSHAGQEQHSPFSHAGQEQQQMGHASHQQPFSFHASYQQPHAVTHGEKASPGWHPSCMTVAASVAAVVAVITVTLLVLFLNRPPTSAAQPPAVVINGSAIPGQTLVVQGSHFPANTTVTVTLDDQPLSAGALPATMSILQLTGRRLPSSGTPVHVGGNGAFSLMIQVDPQWNVGSTHTVRIYDQTGKFVLSKDFVVISDTTPRIASCSASTPTPTVSLGPLTQGQSQSVTAAFSLCTQGKGIVNWSSAWDHNQAPWLQLDQTSGQAQAPQTQKITMSASGTNLQPGTYTTIVTFSDNTTQVTVDVSLTVKAQPTATPTTAPPPTPTPTTAPAPCIKASVQSLTFSDQQGQADPAVQNVTVTNCGSVSNSWSAMTTTQSGGNWLSISPVNGSLNAAARQTEAVKVSNSNMAVGNYQGTVTFSMGTQTAAVTVAFNVAARPNPVCVQPASSTLSFSAAHQTAPAAQTLKLNNACDAGNWSASADSNWITINPTNGSIGANTSTNVSISVSISNLAAGSHSGMITFSSGTTTAKVTVNLSIQAPTPCIALSSSSLTFNEPGTPVITSILPLVPGAAGLVPAATGGTDSQIITISNPAPCDPGSWSASSDAGWLTTNPTGGQIAGNGGSASVTINVAFGSLAPNTYTGHITFTAGTSSATLTVTLNVQQQAGVQTNNTTLFLSPASASTATLANCGGPGGLAVATSKSWPDDATNDPS